MTHQVAGFSVNPSRCSQRCPFMTNLSSSTFARVVIALDVFDDKDNKFFACLCSSVESSTEVSPLVCAHFDTSRLFLGITVAIGTDGFRVERRYFLSLRCLWRWIGNLFLGICAMGWIRDDPARQHGNARALRACIWAGLDKLPLVRTLLMTLHGNLYRHVGHLSQLICSQHREADLPSSAQASDVCDTEALPADVQTTSPRSCRQRPFALSEVVHYRLALQAICSVVVIPTSASLPCATSSSELNEISPHSLLETRTILFDIRLHRAICADLDNLAGCHVWCASRWNAQRGHPS